MYCIWFEYIFRYLNMDYQVIIFLSNFGVKNSVFLIYITVYTHNIDSFTFVILNKTRLCIMHDNTLLKVLAY